MSAVANRRNETFDGPDFYPTPEWAVKALLSKEEFVGTIHEPCCGDGAISNLLCHTGFEVISSDLHDRGFGIHPIDAKELTGPVENIITNPPYNEAEAMIDHFLKIYQRKMALLLRLSFLESKRRYNSLFSINPPASIYIFSERLSLCRSGDIVNGGGIISYGWFVWKREYVGRTILDWLEPIFKANVKPIDIFSFV